jgi:hypothetical protein
MKLCGHGALSPATYKTNLVTESLYSKIFIDIVHYCWCTINIGHTSDGGGGGDDDDDDDDNNNNNNNNNTSLQSLYVNTV